MDPLDLILAKLAGAWDVATQYFAHPDLILAAAVIIFLISLAAINHRD